MVNTFEKWVSAVKTKYDELEVVRDYLNETGESRRKLFSLLYDLANYCRTATELVEWIDNPENLELDEVLILQDYHARSPISRLRTIASHEAETTECADEVKVDKEKVINQLIALKKNHPDQVVLIETPNGTVSLKIGEAQIFEGMRGEIVVDNE